MQLMIGSSAMLRGILVVPDRLIVVCGSKNFYNP